ncbi:NAD(P)/FAD-dependent oxidoreductase [Paenibacillus whitsoniae]|uniref:FAD-binding oxidoreductase n=1 Tax=Paenibacillus whitsoniae TaxID=2496558 RepID=A0A3S0A8R2_9BACL|nr:FAD-dependent oxidoreductase [Paenibacillus whitsoniae]RTE06459.1 FAD-binding oxidoreductase [Paenibacillus whitsoniae]
MNLHTGMPVWRATCPHVREYPKLEEDIDCEVLVIGAGDSGALVSYLLMEHGIDTVLIDKRAVAHGSSFASTGLLQFSNDKSLTACLNTFGEAQGLRFYQLCQEALNDLEAISSQLVYSPEFARRPSLYVASCPEDVAMLQEECRALQKYGFPVDFWTEDQIAAKYSFRKPGAIYAQGDAEVNPFKLVNGLIETSYLKGMRVFANTEVFRMPGEKGRLVFRAGRHAVRAQYAVYATGYETQELRRNPNAVLTSAFAMATKPVASFDGWHARSLIWETARPYLYIRTTADNRIVMGGLDEPTTDPEERERMLPRKTELLLQNVQELFPNMPELEVAYSWTGAFGSTHDGLPMVGEQEGFDNSYFMLGYGGNGTVYSAIAAKLVAAAIVHGGHPDLELFRVERPRHASALVW